MRAIRIERGGEVLIPEGNEARGFFERGVGLLGRSHLPLDEALLLPACRSVHTWFMRFTIDLVFLDREGIVQSTEAGLRPWRMMVGPPGTVSVLEMANGAVNAKSIGKGDQLIIMDRSTESA